METQDKRETNVTDEIAKLVLQKCATELRTSSHILLTNSLSQGKLPELWRKDNIIFLFKKGNKEEPLN